VDHYANECKNRKNNELIETLSSLYYFELTLLEIGLYFDPQVSTHLGCVNGNFEFLDTF